MRARDPLVAVTADRQLRADRDRQYSGLYQHAVTSRRSIVEKGQPQRRPGGAGAGPAKRRQLDGCPLSDSQRQQLVASSLQTISAAEQVRQEYQQNLKRRADKWPAAIET